MIGLKMAPNLNQRDQRGGSKTKRQKLKQPTTSGPKRQQAASARRQQAAAASLAGEVGQTRNLGLNLNQSPDDSAWIYGMISNMQMLLQNDQRLKQAVRHQRQQLIGPGAASHPPSGLANGPYATRHAAKSGARSRPSNSSSGYSTPSSLYSAASLSPPFSSPTALVHCAYGSSSSSNSPNSVMTQQSQSTCSSSSSSPSKHMKSSSAPETTKHKSSSSGTSTSKGNNPLQKQQQQQQQILPRSPISRQIKFHEYKGPPQARRPSSQQKQQHNNNNNNNNNHQQQQQQQKQAPTIDTSASAACSLVEQFNGAHHQLQGLQAGPPSTQSITSTLATSMANHQHQCARMAASQEVGASGPLERRMVKAISVAPSAYALAAGSNQPRQVSLQLIRSAYGQQQQVLVLEPTAFEQMQQQDFHQQRAGGSIIVLQQTEPIGSAAGYSTLLMDNSGNSNNDRGGDNNQFQPAGSVAGRSFSVSESNQTQARANFRAPLKVEQQQQQQVFSNQELYYTPSQEQQHLPQATQLRMTNLRSQAYEHQFDASCQMGPNLTQLQQQQTPLGSGGQLAGQQQQFEQMALAVSQDQNQAQYYQSQDIAYVPGSGLGNGLELDEAPEDDTCEIEPTISFDGDLEHGMMMYSEFIDSQDIPLNVDESDWLKKFLPPCSTS